MSIIQVNHVTKEYQLGQLESLKRMFARAAARLRGAAVVARPLFKALDDVDFKVEGGEVLGIIGTNGAGKSTLLKLLARISSPTTGSVKVHGKVAPLIEVGAGLIGDLTGRENVYLNGSILGMKRAEIDRKFDEIVAFAELEEFIDTPVKRYSSGMQVRLGFSIATSVEADILIVDEVLAVGDLAFQRKCFDRIEDMIKRRGSTVLLVSHSIRQVERMCNRVILLDHGRLLKDGDPMEVCNLYYERSNKKVMDNLRENQSSQARVSSSGEVELLSVDVLDADGRSIEEIDSGDPLRIRVRFQLKHDVQQAEIILGTHGTEFIYLTAASTATLEEQLDYGAGVHEVECVISSFPFIVGTYGIRFAVTDQFRRILYAGEMLKVFSVRPTKLEGREPPSRMINVPAYWSLDGTRHPRIGDSLGEEIGIG